MNTTPLSSIDHVFTGTGSHPIEFVFSYAGTIDSARLQSSFEETLEQFPLLRSKILRITDRAYGFHPDLRGVSFQTTRSSATFVDCENLYQLLDPVESTEGQPLTRIKLTQTPTGPVLGVSISHALVDGFSYFHFLSSWSRIFKGNPVVAPTHRRELLIPETSDHGKPVTPGDVLARAGFFLCEERGELRRDQIHWERLRLSRPKLSELLRQAQKEREVRFSYNDVITAHLWKKFAREWRDGSSNPTSYVTCPVDIRRIPAALPKTYFGCAVCLATASMGYQELEASSLGEVASTIRAAIGKVDRTYALGSLEILEGLRRQKGLEVIQKIHVTHPLDGLLVTNISRLPIVELDFGAGPPTEYRILTPAQRAAVILPATDGVEIRVCHPPGSIPSGRS